MRRKLTSVAVAAVVLAGWAAGPAFAAGWVLQSTPNPSGVPLAALGGVACVSASDCIAVGNGVTSGSTSVPVAEYWNGSTWALQSPANPGGAAFLSVSCTASNYCEAVGDDNSGGLAEHWNGSTWAAQTTPEPAGARLSGVSCTSTTNCEAVGTDNAGALAEHWNGSTWAQQTTPAVTGASFTGVSCYSTTSCTGVGTIYNSRSGAFLGLAERWNGSTWAQQTFVDPGGDTEPFAVSCASATTCSAVGYYFSAAGTFPLAEYWNGSTWATQTAVNEGGSAALYGLSCTASTSCTAVGVYDNSSGVGDSLAERWNGSTWAVQSTPNPSGSEDTSFAAAACPRPPTAPRLATGTPPARRSRAPSASSGPADRVDHPAPGRHGCPGRRRSEWRPSGDGQPR